MLLTKPFYTKTSFFGSLISKVRSNPVASISLSSVDGAADAGTKDVTARKTLEERVGLPPRPKKPLDRVGRFRCGDRCLVEPILAHRYHLPKHCTIPFARISK